MSLKISNFKIAVIGLGYVGLPLLVSLSKKFDCIGYDINKTRIQNLKKKKDETEEIKITDKLNVTNRIKDLASVNFFIVSVPTPINSKNDPDILPIKKATLSISKILKPGSIIVYESTVYPGFTEEICKKIIDKETQLKLNKDYYLGYSPERINPGDKINTLENIVKIVSASNNTALKKINFVYKKVIKAGTFQLKSIKEAEASKVIENTQRDINIGFINELYFIFSKMNININNVLAAAKTKWNFLDFKPGLVGGHCVGIDPYYLYYKCKKIGINPKILISGRKTNDNFHKVLVKEFKKKLSQSKIQLKSLKVLILGATFKPNTRDTRNSRIFNFYNELKRDIKKIDMHDPLANHNEVKKYYNVKLEKNINKKYDACIVASNHNIFKSMKYEKIFSKVKLVFKI